MFTGIVEARGEIMSMESQRSFVRLRIRTDMDMSDVGIGDSICVDGACLTATQIDESGSEFSADVSPESLRVTTLGTLKPGAGVNLEKAMRLDSRLGGHLVSGHVDCTGRLIEKHVSGEGFVLGFQVGSTRYVIEKGSVAIDGISLTVNRVQGDRLWVMIIPHTAALTGLTGKNIGDRVNIEFDLIGKYVEKLIAAPKGETRLSEALLKEHGFM